MLLSDPCRRIGLTVAAACGLPFAAESRDVCCDGPLMNVGRSTFAYVGTPAGAYAIGGSTATFALSDVVEFLDYATQTWILLPPFPVQTAGAAACLDPSTGDVYVVGGSVSGGVSNVIWQLDPIPKTWSQVGSLCLGREAHYSVVHEGKIYTFGGVYGQNVVTDQVECFDLATGCTSRSPMPTPLYGMAGALVDGLVYIFGGKPDLQPLHNLSKAIHVYDPATDSWCTASYTLPGLYGDGVMTLESAVVDGTVILSGGVLNDPAQPNQCTNVTDFVVAFTPHVGDCCGSGCFHEVDPLCSPRQSHGMAVAPVPISCGSSCGSTIIAFGGCDGTSMGTGALLDTTECIDLEGKCCPTPQRYCLSAPNSTGAAALMCSSGDPSIGQNRFFLCVTGAVPFKMGLFFYGPTPTQLPFGNGYLCVSGHICRLNPPQPIGPQGDASRQLDFTQPPANSGPCMITAGSTWYFQFWYRDPAGGGEYFNLSDGLCVTFCD